MNLQKRDRTYFVCYENHSQGFATALKKVLFEPRGMELTQVGDYDGELFKLDENGVSVRYNISADIRPDDDSNQIKLCDYETLNKLLSHFDIDDRECIFLDNITHETCVETKNNTLYDIKDVIKIKSRDVLLSYHDGIFDTLAHYSREQSGENFQDGMEYLKFEYPSLARAILLDIQNKDLDDWKGNFGDIEILTNRTDEFLGTFSINAKDTCFEYVKKYTLHILGDGNIEISANLKLCNTVYVLQYSYESINNMYSRILGENEFNCWEQKSCHGCDHKKVCRKYYRTSLYGIDGEYDYFRIRVQLDLCDFFLSDTYSFENISLDKLFAKFRIYPQNVAVVLNDGKSFDKIYKSMDGQLFTLKSKDAKRVGYTRYIFNEWFYAIYDMDGNVVNVLNEDDFQKFIEDQNNDLTIKMSLAEDVGEEIGDCLEYGKAYINYNFNKPIYTIRYVTLDRLLYESEALHGMSTYWLEDEPLP